MRPGLKRLPTRAELADAYERLLHSQVAQTPALPEVALFSQWSRLDPRLAEIWVAYISRSWRTLHPIAFHLALREMPWPQAVGPLLEFASEGDPLFRSWCRAVTNGLTPVSGEQFFIGQRKIGGAAMFDDARLALKPYRKWGYLAREELFNKAEQRPCRPSYLPETRQEILRTLLERKPRISICDYLEAIQMPLSRRQAERDLKRSRLVRARGNTRARVYERTLDTSARRKSSSD